MADRQYVGKGKIVGQFGNIKIGIKAEDLKPNDRGYVNLIVSKMREPDKYGNEYTVYVDDYAPSQNTQSQAQREDDLPF